MEAKDEPEGVVTRSRAKKKRVIKLIETRSETRRQELLDEYRARDNQAEKRGQPDGQDDLVPKKR